MNRSILIVICDFLLVSLLLFSTPDIEKVTNPGGDHAVKMELNSASHADSKQDLGNVMRLALNEERKSRDQLLGELNKARDTASQQQTVLSEREKQVQTFQQELQTRQ